MRTERKADRVREDEGGASNPIDSDDGGRTLGVISMRALGIRSSYKGRTVDAQAMRGDEGRGQLRKASGSR
jgi:hypothetical protein